VLGVAVHGEEGALQLQLRWVGHLRSSERCGHRRRQPLLRMRLLRGQGWAGGRYLPHALARGLLCLRRASTLHTPDARRVDMVASSTEISASPAVPRCLCANRCFHLWHA
jgi:hypothetical protein